jgi:cell wall-associated NlpC family hydrolase
MDRRLTPANGRVAAAHLRGQVTAERFVKGEALRICVPVADLVHEPHGRRERQMLLGDPVTVFERREGWAFVQSGKDGYVGYLRAGQFDERGAPTHWVTAAATHLYPEPDIKRIERARLPFGARLRVLADAGARFLETEDGYVPRAHLAPLDWHFRDPVAVAALFLGTPYLWGGNSRDGIDCSGLVQTACLACGIACPADSDQQAEMVGQSLLEAASLHRGDLVFWKGHVGMVVNHNRLIHANAHHMAVACEPQDEAEARIAAQGNGAPLIRRRLVA